MNRFFAGRRVCKLLGLAAALALASTALVSLPQAPAHAAKSYDLPSTSYVIPGLFYTPVPGDSSVLRTNTSSPPYTTQNMSTGAYNGWYGFLGVAPGGGYSFGGVNQTGLTSPGSGLPKGLSLFDFRNFFGGWGERSQNCTDYPPYWRGNTCNLGDGLGAVYGRVAEDVEPGVYTPVITGMSTSTYTLIVANSPSLVPQKKDLVIGQEAAVGNPSPGFGWRYGVSSLGLTSPGAGLPEGLGINPENGRITGRPVGAVAQGLYTPVVTASIPSVTFSANTVTATYTLLLDKPLTLSPRVVQASPRASVPPILPHASGAPVASYSLVGSPNTTPAGASAYPLGLSLDPHSGVISGRLDNSVKEGIYTFGLEAFAKSVESQATSDAARADYTLLVDRSPELYDRRLTAYPQSFVSLAPSYAGLLTAYSLKDSNSFGLTLNPTSGLLSGTLDKGLVPGLHTLVLSATAPSVNSLGALVSETSEARYVLDLLPAPRIASQAFDAVAGVGVSVPVSPSASIGWSYRVESSQASLPGGGLPAGLSLDPSSGAITGTVSAEVALGLYTPVVAVGVSGVASSATVTYSILVRKDLTLAPQSLAVSPGESLSLAPRVVGGPSLEYLLLADPGNSPDSNLVYPSGLSLDAQSGVLSGKLATDLAQGVYSFPVAVFVKPIGSDFPAYIASASYTLTVTDSYAPSVRSVESLSLAPQVITATPGQTLIMRASLDGGRLLVTKSHAILASAGFSPKGTSVYPSGLKGGRGSFGVVGSVDASVAQGIYVFPLEVSALSLDSSRSTKTATALYTVVVLNPLNFSPLSVTVKAGGSLSEAPSYAGLPTAFAPNPNLALNSPGNGLPSGISIDPASGLLRGRVGDSVAPGLYTFEVVASAPSVLTPPPVQMYITGSPILVPNSEAPNLLVTATATALYTVRVTTP